MSAPLSTLDALARGAAQAPDAVLVEDIGGRRLTRVETWSAVEGAARALHAHGLRPGQPVALLVSDAIDWTVLLLALEWVGCLAVVLPDFFSDAQLVAVLADSGADVLIADAAGARRLGGRVERVLLSGLATAPTAGDLPPRAWSARQVVYSSGTTGRPTGVVHAACVLDAKAAALAAAVQAEPADHVLSVLPMALLLEQVVAVRAVLARGARVTFAQALLPRGPAGLAAGLVAVGEAVRPTVGVVTPDLLKVWLGGLTAAGRRAPDSLRFLAVGGAPLAPALAEAAQAQGLPVHEGYGLTETASVATVNRPGQRAAGTVGTPLPGVRVVVEDGELVIESDHLMVGYRDGRALPLPGRWRTGDLGRVEADGRVVVLGRRDSVLVLPSGRNVHPEWVESHLLADPRLVHCCVLATAEPRPVAVVEAAAALPADAVAALVGQGAADLPAYAQPGRVLSVAPGTFRAHGLLTGNGRLRRAAIAAFWDRREAASDLLISA